MCFRTVSAMFLVCASLLFASDIPRAETHNNEVSAGVLTGNVLRIDLIVREAQFFPEDEGRPSLVVPTFGLASGPALVPGPFVRVKVGTEIHASIRNELAVAVKVHGLRSRHAPDSALDVPAGETREVNF